MSKYPHLPQDPLNIHLLANLLGIYGNISLNRSSSKKTSQPRRKKKEAHPGKYSGIGHRMMGVQEVVGTFPKFPQGVMRKNQQQGQVLGPVVWNKKLIPRQEKDI